MLCSAGGREERGKGISRLCLPAVADHECKYRNSEVCTKLELYTMRWIGFVHIANFTRPVK
jgi:hypothetical protein